LYARDPTIHPLDIGLLIEKIGSPRGQCGSEVNQDIHEHIVRALYRGVLRREGDPSGLAQFTAFLKSAPDLANIAAAIQGMMASDEFRRLYGSGQSRLDLYQDFAQGAYRAILKRDADAAASDNWANELHAEPGHETVARLLDDMMASNEFRARQKSAMFDEVMRSTAALGPKIEPGPILCIISLGPACYVSTMLDRWELRNFAGPFDYLFSSPRMVEAVLRDDFETFMSKDQFEFTDIGHGEVQTNHKAYATMADYPPGLVDGPVFMHHNMFNPLVYDHFVRAIARMRRALATRSLLITMVRDRPGRGHEIASLSHFISQIAPEARLLSIIFDNPAGNALPEMQLIHQKGHHRIYYMRPVSEMGISGFEATLDEVTVMRIVHQWSFDLQPL
jgi:hypothetical protein